ncbi:hypothetical protein YV76_004692 [Salmonella enterica subsp. enterica]|nr:hypothetical protein [Salmonella enterica subsp. enterica]
MITYDDLVNGFGESVEELEKNLFKFRIELPKFTVFYYLLSADGIGDILLSSKGCEDDKFAFNLYAQLSLTETIYALKKTNIHSNMYGFDSLLLIPPNYHNNLRGILDNKRDNLVLCAPIFHYEFSGKESVDEFREMSTKRVFINEWTRKPVPKILIQFNNPRTGTGTIDNRSVLTNFSYLMSEINNLNGVAHGFINVMNYLDEVIRITSGTTNVYRLSSATGEEDMSGDILNERIKEFLTK